MPNRSQVVRASLLTAVLAMGAGRVSAGFGPDDDRSYRAGIGLLSKGLNDLAITEFRKYLDESPDGSEATNARYSLAICLTRLNRHAEALKELVRVVKIDGFEFAPDALLLQAQCHLAAGDDLAAVSVLKDASNRYPSFDHADRVMTILGECLYRLGRFKEAEAILTAACSKWPQSPGVERAELFSVMAQASTGDVRAAAEQAATLRTKHPNGEYTANVVLVEAQCRQQLRELPAAASLFEIASGGPGPVRTQALLGLAGVARSQGDLTRAAKALADIDASAVPPEYRELVLLERGKLCFQQDNTKAAQTAFSEAKKSGTDAVKAEASLWFAKCQLKQGKVEEAVANLEQAAERFSESTLVPDMMYERAAALSNAGDSQALGAWAEWRRRFPGSDLEPDALIAQAWCAHRQGEFDKCEELCRMLASEYPERARSESAELVVAENAFATQQYEKALDRYSQFTKHYPKGPYAWRGSVRLALSLGKLGRKKEASAALESAIAAGGDQDASLRRFAIGSFADQAFSDSDWSVGEKWFQRLVVEGGESDDVLDARLRQGICVQRQGRFADCLPIFEKVEQDGPGTTQALQARFERGQALLELGRFDDARTPLEQVANAKDGAPHLRPHALRHLATIASKEGRHDDAAEILGELRESGGQAQMTESALDLGSALLAAGKYGQAEQALTEVIKSNRDQGNLMKARVLRGIAINRQGRHDEAVSELQEASEDSGIDLETRTSGRYELALALRDLGRDEEAAAVLRAVVRQSSPRLGTFATLELAQFASKSKAHEDALKLLDECLAAADKLGQVDNALIKERATYLRAVCLLKLGRHREAAEALTSFESKFATSQLLPSASLVRGEALLASGQAKEAAEAFSRAAQPTSPPEVQSTGLLKLGDAWAAFQEWEKSEKAFTAFLDRFTESPLWFQARFGQAWALENQGQHEPAIKAYRDVVARHNGPTAARAQFQIGECLYAQEQYESAVSELLKTDVLFAYPEWSAAALYEAGRCLSEMNRPGDSSKQFEDLIKRFPETRWAKLASERSEKTSPSPVPGRAAPVAPQGR